jgi:hypothetical protein
MYSVPDSWAALARSLTMTMVVELKTYQPLLPGTVGSQPTYVVMRS